MICIFPDARALSRQWFLPPLVFLLLVFMPLSLAVDTRISISGPLELPRVSFTTQPFYTYTMESSYDLAEWNEIGGTWLGDGVDGYADIVPSQERMFFRVREAPGTFMTRPMEGQPIIRTDGVVFAFNMNGFSTLPAKIRIYQRPWNTGAPWTQIGLITDFTTRDGVSSVRGSVVWVDPANGEYEVKAQAVTAAGVELAVNQRHISVVEHTPPTVDITSGPVAVSSFPVEAIFTTTVSPVAEVRRVEFYDNGVLMAADSVAPFGDDVLNYLGNRYFIFRGSHQITAKAYDRRGVVSAASNTYTVEVTGGPIRPTLTISPPLDGSSFNQGANINIPFVATFPPGDVLNNVQAATTDFFTPAGASHAGESFFEPIGSLLLDTDNWEPGSHVIRATSIGRTLTPPDTEEYAESYEKFLPVYIRPSNGSVHAQTIAGNLAAPSVTTSLPSFTGYQTSSKVFSQGLLLGLQIDSGVVLTTGFAEDWDNGDYPGAEWGSAHESTGYIHANPGDTQMKDWLGTLETWDASGFQCNVFSPNRQLELEYQLGSDEYDEFIESHNDTLLVTVKGVIVSVLPDGSDLVRVNTINLNANRDLFLGDDEDIDPEDTRGQTQVEYDGTTVALKIHALVSPGSNYVVRIVVADVKDAKFDSAVFLKQGSLRSIAPQP